MYHIALILLLVGAVIEFKNRKTPIRYFYATFLLLTLMLSLRYGQGTDYFTYELMYDWTPANFFALFSYYGFRVEYGWCVLMWFFRLFNLPFPAFMFLISIAEMALLFLFVQKFCKRRMLALLVSYHTLYLSWFFGIIRQGLVMAVFLGLMLDWLLQKKYIHYCIACILCGCIHGVGFLLLAAPVVHTKLLSTLKWQLILIGAAWAVGIIIATGVFDSVLSVLLPDAIAVYLNRKGISFFAILERVVSYSVTAYIYWMSAKTRNGRDTTMAILFQIVTLGMIVYGGFLWLPLVASRMGAVFKIVEIAIWSSLCISRSLQEKIKVAFCVGLTLLMYTKNIAAYIVEGAYYKDRVNVFNFPYVSVFDQDAIHDYRAGGQS